MAIDHIVLPCWNDLSDDERTRLVNKVSEFAWPPGLDGQFAIEFYGEIRNIMYEHRPTLPMKE